MKIKPLSSFGRASVVWRVGIGAALFLLLITFAVVVAPENSFDHTLTSWLGTIRTPAIIGIAGSLSMLFDGVVALVIAIAISIAVLFVWGRRAALFLFVTLAGGYLAVGLTKILVDRPRPPLPVFLFTEHIGTASFPSGHAALSLLLFGALWWLIRTRLTKTSARLVLIAVTILVLLFGLARLVLGVHWASDVVGGYLVGLVVLCKGILWYEGELGRILFLSPAKAKSPGKKVT
ncbi:MAG: phosphatase PAP2 family protein [Parcubacteria group bacterium]|nr:phosphatase PAP2 family protein [Parcubacteria group bacterium]